MQLASVPRPTQQRLRGLATILTALALLLGLPAAPLAANGPLDVPRKALALAPGPSLVATPELPDGTYRYLVNGQPSLMIGMGYNPIYRNLSNAQRAARYDRDFAMLCRVGVNTVVGWDADKGYDQDKFDEVTLNAAARHDLGVLMPFYLPATGNYLDSAFLNQLLEGAKAKVLRFRDHPALRLWGVGNEVLDDMPDPAMAEPFLAFYIPLVDAMHALDPNHPIIYRAAEDTHIALMAEAAARDGRDRPWLLFGTNSYSGRLGEIIDGWPARGYNKPLFVTEFGAEDSWPGGRAMGYRDMWRLIRAHGSFVLGGAPYAWTTAGPEPTDAKWGLLDADGRPVDLTFGILSIDWLREPQNQQRRPCG